MTGLELFKAPGTTAGEIADIVSNPCPPVVPEVCDKFSCRECWQEWLEGNETDKKPSPKRTAPYQPHEKATERKIAMQKSRPYHCPQMRSLRELLETWQKENDASYSALKVCFNAFLAEEEKRASISRSPIHLPPPQSQEV